MRMKKLTWLIALVVIVVLTILAGCSSFQSKYVGTWTDQSFLGKSQVVLNANGTGSASGAVWPGMPQFQWQEEGDSIRMTGWEMETGKLSPDGNMLHLSGPGTYTDLAREK